MRFIGVDKSWGVFVVTRVDRSLNEAKQNPGCYRSAREKVRLHYGPTAVRLLTLQNWLQRRRRIRPR